MDERESWNVGFIDLAAATPVSEHYITGDDGQRTQCTEAEFIEARERLQASAMAKWRSAVT